LPNLTRGTGGIFFGDTPATINTIDEAENGMLTVFTQVPELTDLGEYKVIITTPNEMVISPINFVLTELSNLAPAPAGQNNPEITITTIESEPEIIIQDQPEIEINSNPEPLVEASETLSSELVMVSNPPAFFRLPPQNLLATPVLNGIALEWNAPSGEINHFNIYYGTSSGKYLHRVISQNSFAVLDSNFIFHKAYFS
jgi:hypothetical protein